MCNKALSYTSDCPVHLILFLIFVQITFITKRECGVVVLRSVASVCQSVCLSVCVSVCLCVRSALTFESFDQEGLFLVHRYVFGISQLCQCYGMIRVEVKVTGAFTENAFTGCLPRFKGNLINYVYNLWRNLALIFNSARL